ncbi:MAG: hypothetical protein QM723_04425 [Myxococcaceae bacterium]
MADFTMFWPADLCQQAQRLNLGPQLREVPAMQKFFADRTGLNPGDRLFAVTLVSGRLHLLGSFKAVAELPIKRWRSQHPDSMVDRWSPRAQFVLEVETLAPLRFGLVASAEALKALGVVQPVKIAQLKDIRRLKPEAAALFQQALDARVDRSVEQLRSALAADPWNSQLAAVLSDALLQASDPAGDSLALELKLATERDGEAVQELIKGIEVWTRKNRAIADAPGGFPYRPKFRQRGHLQIVLWNCALRAGERPAFDALVSRLFEAPSTAADGTVSGPLRHPEGWVLPQQPVKMGREPAPSYLRLAPDELFGILRFPEWNCDVTAARWLEDLRPLLAPGVGLVQRRRFSSVGNVTDLA